MGSIPTALTTAQVNSWPRPTSGLSITGERVTPGEAKDDSAARFLQLARDRFQMCVEAERTRRAEMLLDMQFHCGEQWDKAIELKRISKGRPCHTINRLPEFTDHVVNNMRQSRPGIRVDPVGDNADQEQADIRQGLIRHIERNSQAEVTYDTAMEKMCITGLGWARIVDDWAAPDSFDKDLFIRWVSNPFTVYYDPNCEQPDWSDGKFAFVINDLTPADFVSQFGEKFLASNTNNFQSLGDHQAIWFPGNKIRVAEYFRIEQEKDTLCEVDGKSVLYSALPSKMYSVQRDEYGKLRVIQQVDGSDVGRARECFVPVVYWSLITGLDKLEERKWKGPFIPLIPFIGHQVDLDGERRLIGMVRYAREIQRMYNYVYSTLTEVIALAPRNQWVAAIDQLGEFRDLYESSNTDPQAVLPYVHQSSENGAPLPPPQRQSTDIAIAGLVQALQVIDNMLKSIFGIYDASLGQRGPQESGLAINARKIESDTSTFNWGDNFIRGLQYLGRQLNELLPFYYNTPGRIVQILRDDQSSDAVVMNQEFIDKETGKVQRYNLDDGKFSVVISTGPSQQTKRQASVQGMLEFFKLYPPGLQACAHILVGEMDFPGKDALKTQLEKILPPNLKEPDENGPQIPPEVQQQMAQSQQMIQQLTAALHQALDKNDLQHMKEEFATLRTQITAQANIVAAALKTGSDEGRFMAEQGFQEAERLRAKAEGDLEQPSSGAGQPAAPAAVQPGQP